MVVYTALGISEAHMIANLLKSEGIPAFVNHESLASVMGINFGMGEISVLVNEANYEEALSILDAEEMDQLPSDVDYIIVDTDTDDEDVT